MRDRDQREMQNVLKRRGVYVEVLAELKSRKMRKSPLIQV